MDYFEKFAAIPVGSEMVRRHRYNRPRSDVEEYDDVDEGVLCRCRCEQFRRSSAAFHDNCFFQSLTPETWASLQQQFPEQVKAWNECQFTAKVFLLTVQLGACTEFRSSVEGTSRFHAEPAGRW